MREPEASNPSTGDDLRARALARIAVRPPYFALGTLEARGDGAVAACIPVAPPKAPERGAIEAAQVARHLAILGSCAAALSRDDDAPHHYLATQAHFARLSGGPEVVPGGLLEAEAIATWIDKRSARALATLSTIDGQGLHLLDVRYSVLTPRMFERLNPPIEHPEATPPAERDGRGSGPEAEPTVDLDEIVSIGADGIEVDGGVIPVDACAGHFPGHPAAPVAIVMGRLCRAAGLALAARLEADVTYRIEAGRVTATRLASAGQRLTFTAAYVQPAPGGHLLRGTASADGEVVGEVEVTMSAAEAAEAAASVGSVAS